MSVQDWHGFLRRSIDTLDALDPALLVNPSALRFLLLGPDSPAPSALRDERLFQPNVPLAALVSRLLKNSKSCHPERSEGSALRKMPGKQQIPPRFAPRNDTRGECFSRLLEARQDDEAWSEIIPIPEQSSEVRSHAIRRVLLRAASGASVADGLATTHEERGIVAGLGSTHAIEVRMPHGRFVVGLGRPGVDGTMAERLRGLLAARAPGVGPAWLRIGEGLSLARDGSTVSFPP